MSKCHGRSQASRISIGILPVFTCPGLSGAEHNLILGPFLFERIDYRPRHRLRDLVRLAGSYPYRDHDLLYEREKCRVDKKLCGNCLYCLSGPTASADHQLFDFFHLQYNTRGAFDSILGNRERHQCLHRSRCWRGPPIRVDTGISSGCRQLYPDGHGRWRSGDPYGNVPQLSERLVLFLGCFNRPG